MTHRSMRLAALSSMVLVAGCAGDSKAPSGPGVTIEVAPLKLPGTLGVEYALAVFNADPADYTQIFDVDGAVLTGNDDILVWQEPSVTSNRFGNGPGGAISYVGPCDSTSDDNWVALALGRIDVGPDNGSYDAGAGAFSGGSDNLLDDQNSANTDSPGSDDGDPDFINPCPFNDACVLDFPCEENQDTSVVFNLTIMRDADQGFFDIAVNFEDIFCSAKVDCSYDEFGDDPIELLFDGSGDRARTAVFGLACTHGTGQTGTVLHLNGVRVECGEDLGQAMAPLAQVTTCTTDDEIYGAVQGNTADGEVAMLPVAWREQAGVKTATALPIGEFAGGLVYQALDANHILGFVRAAGGVEQLPRQQEVRRNGFYATHIATWNRADASAGWALQAAYALPTGATVSSLEEVAYDKVAGRLWLNARTSNGAGPVFFEKQDANWTFALGPTLDAIAGMPYCTVQHVRGGIAVGNCQANQLAATASASKQVANPGQESRGLVWSVAGGAPAELPTTDLFAGSQWVAVRASALDDGSVVGTVWSDDDQAEPKIVRWVYGTDWSAPTQVANGSIAWLQGDAMAISSESAAPLWRWNGATWDSWDSFAHGADAIAGLVPAGYIAEAGLVYGIAEVAGGEAQPWVAQLPASGNAVTLELLPVAASAAALPFSFAGSYAGLTGTTLVYKAEDSSGMEAAKTFAYRYSSGSGLWYGVELLELESAPAIEPRGKMANADFVQSCDAMLGNVLDVQSKELRAASWAIAADAPTRLPKTYAAPAVILSGDAQLGGYVGVDLDPTIVGNAWQSPHSGDAVWQYAIYSGAESLLCDNVPCQKVYWNTAVGFDTSLAGCHLIAEATAAPNPGLVAGTTADNTTYPIIVVDVPLTSTPTGNEPVELLCTRHPLDDSGEVKTIYTSVKTPQQFCHRFDGTTATTLTGCEWTPYADKAENISKDLSPISENPRGRLP